MAEKKADIAKLFKGVTVTDFARDKKGDIVTKADAEGKQRPVVETREVSDRDVIKVTESGEDVTIVTIDGRRYTRQAA